MFETLKQQPADKILQLMLMYAADPREQKIDLGVGVYKNADGITPVMRAVKAAEKRIWEAETTKTYTGLTGDSAFTNGMISLLLDESVARDTIAAVATTGGTGAVRLGFELILAQSYRDPELSGDRDQTLSLFQRRDAGRRFRRDDRRSARRGTGRCSAAAWVLPQPDRGQPEPGAMAGGGRSAERSRSLADDRHRLSGLW
jgi:hypothetical protein